jgi:hypothetical protein
MPEHPLRPALRLPEEIAGDRRDNGQPRSPTFCSLGSSRRSLA